MPVELYILRREEGASEFKLNYPSQCKRSFCLRIKLQSNKFGYLEHPLSLSLSLFLCYLFDAFKVKINVDTHVHTHTHTYTDTWERKMTSCWWNFDQRATHVIEWVIEAPRNKKFVLADGSADGLFLAREHLPCKWALFQWKRAGESLLSNFGKCNCNTSRVNTSQEKQLPKFTPMQLNKDTKFALARTDYHKWLLTIDCYFG